MPHEIISNSGDSLDEDAIRALLGRATMSGYVEEGGVTITYHSADDTADVAAGDVHILDNGQDITIETDAFVGEALVADAVNHLWIAADPSAATDDEAVSLESNATGVGPSMPSLKIGTVDTTQSGAAAVDPLNRGTPAALSGTSLNLGGLQLYEEAVQTALDGYVVAVAPGVGVNDAIPTDRDRPIQDAIDRATAASSPLYGGEGQGSVLLPPGTTTEAGPLSGYGGLSIRGHGPTATEIGFTDTSRPGFHITNQNEIANSYLDGFTVDGWNTADRSASGGQPRAFHVTDNGGGINANVGRLVFDKFPGPVVHFEGTAPYGSTWDALSMRSYSHSNHAFRAEDCFMPAFSIGRLDCGPSDPSIYAVYIQNANFGGAIGAINSGGASGRVLYFEGSTNADNLGVGHINSEPNDPETVQNVVRLDGDGYCNIRHIKVQGRLSTTDTVRFANDSTKGVGPANNTIQNVRDAPSNAKITIQFQPTGESWYFGRSEDVDYGGYNPYYVRTFGDHGTFETRAVSGALEADHGDYVKADASGGAFTVDLPPAKSDIRVAVKKVDSSANVVTVGGGGGNIEGATSVSLGAQYDGVDVICDGANWHEVS